MSMHARTRSSVVLAGVLLLATSGCKDDAAESGAAESPDDSTPAADQARPGATPTDEPESEAPAAPEPPATGHAVAKIGALLFTSSTGQVGFELPPLAQDDAVGVTVHVVGEQDGRLVIETLAAQPPEHHCASSLSKLSSFRLRLFMEPDDLLPVLAEDLEQEYSDGTVVRVSRGVPVVPGTGATELNVRGTRVPVTVPTDRLGRIYEPARARDSSKPEGTIYPHDSESLEVDGKPLDEDGLTRDGDLAHFGTVAKAGSSRSLVTVRNACLEVVADVSNERLSPPPEPSIHAIEPSARLLGALGSSEGGMLGTLGASSDEDVWGGLTGAEVGEAFGVGGLGLVGTGRGGSLDTYEVKAGTAIVWPDGSAAGQVTADHRFEQPPRDQQGHSCFDAELTREAAPTVTLCFAPGDVREIEGVATGFGTIGIGSGLGSSGTLGTLGTLGSTGSGSGTGSGYGTGSGSGGSGKRVPRVRQAKASVKGSLDKDIIRRIVRAHINEVRYCYNQGLVRDPSLEGRVAVQFTIGPKGTVPVSVVASTSLGDKNVGNCIAKAVKRWKFPKPTDGGVVVVTYPFSLSPG